MRRDIEFRTEDGVILRGWHYLPELLRGVHTPESSSITVTEAAALWLKCSELEQLERSTLRQYDNHVTRHILPLLGSVKLARLSTPVVQLFCDKLLEKLDIAQLINAAKPRSKRRCSCTPRST